ncbi:hypothetical protein R8G00_19015 [Escherichia coli]|uniref:Tail fiber protein n=1 Tax=Escherichia coli TaxID=562 RepID=A0AAP6B1T3_ECOLX|nr:hypothetical protein [Escherichia coli]MDW9351621.1 hypothetical protein [Escherichia coli]
MWITIAPFVTERGGWLKGHHSGMPYWAQGSTTEMRPKNIAFNYIVKAS